jgi:hypothetical protein
MLETATTQYLELIVEEKWLPKKKQAASFQAQGLVALPSDGNTPPRVIDRNHLPAGEPSIRKTLEGQWDEHWCGKCCDGGRWGNHSKGDHNSWVDKMKARNEQRKLRKAAHATPTVEPPTPAPDTDTGDPTRLHPAGRNHYTIARTIFGTHGNISTNF